jgi:hypothetical protein
MESQMQPKIDEYGNRISRDTYAAERRSRTGASKEKGELREQMMADRLRGEQLNAELTSRVGDVQKYMRGEWANMLRDHESQVDDAMTGVADVRALLDQGVAHQVLGAVGGIKADKAKALAEFEANWSGPRDQRYAMAKQAIETQFNAASQNQKSQLLEKHAELSGTMLTQAYDSVNDLRSGLASAEGQAFYGLTQAEAENMETLRRGQGDLMGLIESSNRTYTDAATRLFAEVEQTRREGLAIRTGAEQWATGIMADAVRMDEDARFTYMQTKRAIGTQEASMLLQAEAQYAGMLFNAMDRASQFAAMEIEMTFNRSFGTALLAPVFNNFFEQMTSMRGSGLAERQFAAQQDQWATQNLQGWLGIGTSAVSAGGGLTTALGGGFGGGPGGGALSVAGKAAVI